MTVIAWDGTTLAADKLCNLGSVAFTGTKLARVDDAQGRPVTLLAFAGTGARMGQLVEWFRRGAVPDDYPPRPADDDSVLVAITRRGGDHKISIQRFESTGYALKIEDERYADGGWRDIALAAMACGRSAREAVELTATITVMTGRGVDTLTFDP